MENILILSKLTKCFIISKVKNLEIMEKTTDYGVDTTLEIVVLLTSGLSFKFCRSYSFVSLLILSFFCLFSAVAFLQSKSLPSHGITVKSNVRLHQ